MEITAQSSGAYRGGASFNAMHETSTQAVIAIAADISATSTR